MKNDINSVEEPLLWVPSIDPKVLSRMFPEKLRLDYERPTRLDIEAQQAIIISQRPTCLFYNVGTRIFHVLEDGNFHFISDGYNGPSKGDVDPRIAGCARVIGGVLKQGGGHCRGSHSELNAIANAPVDLSVYKDVRMMVTLHPCYTCAKQIVNRGIKKVYYIWEYGREQFVTDYLIDKKVEVIRHSSIFLDAWIKRNDYRSVMDEHLGGE